MTICRTRRGLLGDAAGVTATLALAACGGQDSAIPNPVAGLRPDGTVEMHEVQAAYMGSGSAGGGTLFHRVRAYPFTIVGAGVGGIGLSTIDARGEVYRLPEVRLFPGTYAQGRYGIAVGTTSAGDLWLQNEAGVIMRLKARREGLMLSLGADAVVISMA
jgi:hypothetical protein